MTEKNTKQKEYKVIRDFSCKYYDAKKKKYVKYEFTKGNPVKANHPILENLKTEKVI